MEEKEKELEELIVNAYSQVKPSDNLIDSVLKTSKKQSKKQGVIILLCEYGLTMAAAFAMFFGVGGLNKDVNTKVFMNDTNGSGSVFSGGSLSVIIIMAALLLCAIFTIVYYKKYHKAD